MVEGKVRIVSVHSVWWRARYVQLVHTQCGKEQVYTVSDIGERDPRSNNILNFIIERSNDSQDPRHSQYQQYSTSPVRNSLLYTSL